MKKVISMFKNKSSNDNRKEKKGKDKKKSESKSNGNVTNPANSSFNEGASCSGIVQPEQAKHDCSMETTGASACGLQQQCQRGILPGQQENSSQKGCKQIPDSCFSSRQPADTAGTSQGISNAAATCNQETAHLVSTRVPVTSAGQCNRINEDQELPRGPSYRNDNHDEAHLEGPMRQLRLGGNQQVVQPVQPRQAQPDAPAQSLQQANEAHPMEDVLQNQQPVEQPHALNEKPVEQPHALNEQPVEQPHALNEEQVIEGDGEQFPVQEQEEAPFQPLVSDLVESKKLLDHVCILLDQHSPVVKNWENLASELGAPQNVIALCRRATHHSSTELLFDTLSSSHKTENLTVNELNENLHQLGRKDAVNLLHKNVPETQRTHKVSEVIQGNDKLMEQLSALLDKESRVIKNWFHLGQKLGLSREILHEIKNGNDPSCVASLFDYIYTTFPGLTVEEFKENMVAIDRKDVIDKLASVEAGKMKEVIPLNTDKMRSICYLLNKNSCGSVKDWKHLAVELNIDHHVYKSFEKELPESPTKGLLEWAANENPNQTVSELCKKFKNIRRFDVIEAVEKTYGQSFSL